MTDEHLNLYPEERHAGKFVPDPWDTDDKYTKGEDDGNVDTGSVPGDTPRPDGGVQQARSE